MRCATTETAVVGAGVGGLTAALALRREGFSRVTVYERQAELPFEGYGIQISPNAAALLDGHVFAAAARPPYREIRRWRDDAVISRIDLQRYRTPYYTMRRGDLIAALASPVVLNAPVRSAADLDAEIVIGADGLNSALHGAIASDRPRDSGYVAYRAVVPAGLDRVVVWLGPGRHLVAYPIGGGVNVVAVVPDDGVALEDGFAEWHPAPRRLIALMNGSPSHLLRDRVPLPCWHEGKVVLIGDAAHPMLPFAAQGAVQAIEDAAALAPLLRHPDAFARFEAARRPRVERIFAMSRAGLQSYHLPDGSEQRRRDRELAAAPANALDWLYGVNS
ncbi:FAD-dependent monooxygenase [Paractinoplanes atraurantiacus]|uniref:Salicylate hydroxylase n=1 Tax=Paractinoplanes atraurantiacus TaxID=1036182 RepID=A0A285I1I4_9ACTN|nr:FAD-dependent monooxygenase [Actinoplanes atraurantiacus]SNY40801.1 salicylate hydroxylase [Actinoplanes atraurantiacus]